ncbi:hypothetical protein V22_00620 [Calycomorphotria hydatis]|uniref:Lipoprotein n=1 Tax=Calycomorphotria hydatis TaxID=2528027 RepID=A0A517T3A7_9PLAN|nr:hypothetical protein V22_00620 [Calycomorphotria hydatis]
MPCFRHASRALFFALLAVSIAGCGSLWHEMQPHRLRRLNQGPGMDTGSDVYSQAPQTNSIRPESLIASL